MQTGSPLPGSSSSERPSSRTADLGRGQPFAWPEAAEAYTGGPDAEFLQGLYLTGESEIVAKELEASRLKMTGRPAFDPVPFLDADAAAHYRDPFDFMKDPKEVTEKLPRPRFRASRLEKQNVLRLLDSTGRLTFHPARDVHPAFTNGLFGLVKSQEKDRLILDARCQNLRESSTGAWIRSMASFTSLLGIHLLPGERLVFGGEDLRDFYYFFEVSRARSLRNVLSGSIPESVARQFTGFEDVEAGHRRYYAALSTLAMGDKNAVSYGQTAHVALLLQTGLVSMSELLSLDNRPSWGDFLIGICIDDLVTLEKIAASRTGAGGKSVDLSNLGGARSSSLLQSIRAKYKEVGLEEIQKRPLKASMLRRSGEPASTATPVTCAPCLRGVCR